jgi:hypothetical protein
VLDESVSSVVFYKEVHGEGILKQLILIILMKKFDALMKPEYTEISEGGTRKKVKKVVRKENEAGMKERKKKEGKLSCSYSLPSHLNPVHVSETDTMGKSPDADANTPSASSEILHILRNIKVHYPVSKSSLFVSILSQMNPGQNL